MLKLAIIRNNLSYEEFRKSLIGFKVFSISDVRKIFPQFDSKRLVEWQQRGYLKKLINKWYLFSEISTTEHLLYRISNCLHHPSYISLESALSYYHLIPEEAYTQQAVSTRKTILYETPVGHFNYRHLKPTLYFGYLVIHKEGLPITIAEPEKTILDYLYLSASVRTKEDIQALRWNLMEIESRFDWGKLYTYARIFKSSTLDKKISALKKIILDAHLA